MGKVRRFLIILFGLVFIGLLAFFFLNQLKTRRGALLIESEPVAKVFIDGQEVGTTPYEATLPPRETLVKLVPEAREVPLAPYETKIDLIGGVKTVVRRVFAGDKEAAYGEIISFEKLANNKEAVIAVVTHPDAVQISLDGRVLGFSPLKIEKVVPGEQQISLSAENYATRNIAIRAVKGYRLTLVVELARLPQADEPEVEAETQTVKEVLIKDTPTGFLRVRQSPSPNALEIARINPGEKYSLLEEDLAAGWYKILFKNQGEELEGWIASQYATIETPL